MSTAPNPNADAVRAAVLAFLRSLKRAVSCEVFDEPGALLLALAVLLERQVVQFRWVGYRHPRFTTLHNFQHFT